MAKIPVQYYEVLKETVHINIFYRFFTPYVETLKKGSVVTWEGLKRTFIGKNPDPTKWKVYMWVTDSHGMSGWANAEDLQKIPKPK